MATPTPAPTSNPPLQAAREDTIDALCLAFAHDVLTLTELERRLARAREARTQEDLRGLVADLGQWSAEPMPTRLRGRGLVEPPDATRTTPTAPRASSAEPRRGSHLAFAVMGGTRRAGKWAPPGKMLAVAIMGGVELDFRNAVLTPGVTEINVFAFWGGVQITVPPEVHVDTHGLAIMGGFEQAADLETSAAPDAPTIRVNGVAIMAGVEVQVRPPGESRAAD